MRPSPEIDIKPGCDPATINPKSHGIVPVAILGSDGFDVTQVDPASLTFGPASAAPIQTNGRRFADTNGDGIMDLVTRYRIPETGIAPGDSEACLRGELLDGMPFASCDAIRTLPAWGRARDAAHPRAHPPRTTHSPACTEGFGSARRDAGVRGGLRPRALGFAGSCVGLA